MATDRHHDRRDAILDRLADHVLAHGLSTASLRPLARAVGTSDRMLLYYFADKPALIEATLERIAARMVGQLGALAAPRPLPLPEAITHIAAIVERKEFWPYMAVWLELAGRAARHDPLFSPIAEAIGRGFLAWGAAQLDVADEATRRRDAVRLLVAIEGRVLVRAIGLGGELDRA